jgi:hypothetical protein
MSGGAVRRLLPTSTESDGRGAQGGQAPPRTRDGGYRFSGGSERLPGARRRARSSS